MRGFSKAAALLSLSRASSLVIPDAGALPAHPVIEYRKQGEPCTSQAKR